MLSRKTASYIIICTRDDRLDLPITVRSCDNREMWGMMWGLCEGYVSGARDHSHLQPIWYQQVIAFYVRDCHYYEKLKFFRKGHFFVCLRQNFAGLRTNFYCPTGKFLFPNWKTCSLTRKSLSPHLKVFAATSENSCRQTWEKVLPDLGVNTSHSPSWFYSQRMVLRDRCARILTCRFLAACSLAALRVHW